MINIVEKLDEQTAKRIKQYSHPNNRPSEAGHPCIRFLVLSRLYLEKKILHDVGLQRIFDEGNLHEDAVLREIQDAGFKIVEQQRPFEWKKFQLSGRIDAKISVNGILIPLEIKSCSPNVFIHVKPLAPEELVNSKYSWVRQYPAQIMLYMIMNEEEEGIIIFKNKATGEKCQKNFKMDYDFTEQILKKLELVNDYVARNELPPVEMSEECKRCGFQKTMCFADMDYGPGFNFISDEEKEAKLIRWYETKEIHDEHRQLDKELKEEFKGSNTIINEFKITSKEIERKEYMVPAGSYWRTTIEKL